jgi:hypothetical protein
MVAGAMQWREALLGCRAGGAGGGGGSPARRAEEE